MTTPNTPKAPFNHGMGGNSPEVEKALETARRAWDRQHAAQRAFEARMARLCEETYPGEFTRLWFDIGA